MSIPDPYKILQVDPEAEEEVVEAAYRRLARKYHPDVSPDPASQERMVRINQAWEILRDPMRRAALDRARLRASVGTARGAEAEAPTGSGAAWTPNPAGGRGAGFAPPRGGFPGVDRRANGAASAGPGGQGSAGLSGRESPGTPGQRPIDATLAGRQGSLHGRSPRDASGSTVDAGSGNWTSGRSSTGGGYDPGTMGSPQGDGAAGPPPGNPSGTVLNFGRYSGWSLGEIARADVGYLEWLDRTPIGRSYQQEIDGILRAAGRRAPARTDHGGARGLFRRR